MAVPESGGAFVASSSSPGPSSSSAMLLSWPVVARQTVALVRKNFIHLVRRRWLSTFVQALLLPIVLTAVFLNIDNFSYPGNVYGLGAAAQVRSFEQSLEADTGDMVFVSNSSMGPDVASVISRMTEPLAHLKDRFVFLPDSQSATVHCSYNFRGVSRCHAALIFDDSPLTPGGSGNWSYTIRVDPSRDYGSQFDVNSHDDALDRVYMPLQLAVNSAITNTTLRMDRFSYTTQTQDEYHTWRRQSWASTVAGSFSIVLFLPLLIPVYHVVNMITTERRDGVSQLVDVMGGGATARVASYVVTFNVLYMPYFLAAGILYWYYLFRASNPAVLLFWFIFTGVALVNSAILGAAMFKGPRLSGILVAACAVALAGGSAVLFNQEKPDAATFHVMSFLFPSGNYVFALGTMLRFAKLNIAVDFARPSLSLSQTEPSDGYGYYGYQTTGDIRVWVCWLFLIIQMVGYPLLAILAEWLIHGISFKRRSFAAADESSVAIETSGLRKIYPPSLLRRLFCCGSGSRETVTAIDGLDLVAQKRQVLCLLGVNGSGKTTTLDVIGGMQASTAGSVRINAQPTQLGVCPQRNVLFPYLTVLEHVRLWSDIKHGGEDNEALSRLVERCDLKHKVSSRARDLSGGQKRKLQLACMLAGGSTVCLMDEVTSGLDPISRRAIWNIILGERSKRSMIFTTHFLDEGETLADHVVLVSKGKIMCQGSGAELKNKFGGGYVVHVPRPAGPGASEPLDMGVPTTLHQDRVQYHVPDSKAAAALIARLERAGQTGIAMSGPTIEDVFLRLTKDVDETLRRELGDNGDVHSDKNGGSTSSAPAAQLASGRPVSSFRQIRVLLRKRATVLRRFWIPPLLALALAAGLPSALRQNLIKEKPRRWVYERPTCEPVEGSGRVVLYEWNSPIAMGLPGPASGAVIPFGPAAAEDPLQAVLHGRGPVIAPWVRINETVGLFHGFDSEDAFYDAFRAGDGSDRSYGGLFVRSGIGSASSFSGSAPASASALIAVPQDQYPGKEAALRWIGMFTAMQRPDVSIAASKGTFQRLSFERGNDGAESLEWIIFASLILTIYPVFFTLYPAYEKTHNIRALQYANGVRPFPLWTAHFLFDFPIVILVSMALTVTIQQQLAMWWEPGHIFVVSALYGLATILMGYLVSRLARSQLAAFLWTLFILLIQYIGAVLAFVLTRAYLDVDELQRATDATSWAMGLFFPIVNMLKAFMVGLNTYRIACRENAAVTYPGHIYAYGGPILLLFVQTILLGLLLVWLESNNSFSAVWYWIKRAARRHRRRGTGTVGFDEEDGGGQGGTGDEISKEAARVEAAADTDLLRMTHITKSFGSNVAVDDVSFGLGEGEILALLGPNGAGKTTMANMIMGELRPDSGHVFLRGVDVHKRTREAQRSLGVCPQFDALDLMTARQHLEFYARIRGVADVARNVDIVLARTGLAPHAEKKASKLSGGNKRKLSLGIALIGNPDVLVLDEPSSSMDAAAKRVMWKTLAEIGPGRSLLLTTHSMEEADALATRAAIVSKRLLAIGTTQQLRDRYSNRYNVQLVLKTAPTSTPEEMQAVEGWVRVHLPGAEFEGDSLGGQVKFTVPNDDDNNDSRNAADGGGSTVGQIIAALEESKEELGLLDYSIGAPTLEKVFLSVVRDNYVEEDAQRKPWWKLG